MPRKLARSFAISITLIFSLFVGVSVYVQVTGATLSGTVTDAAGAVIPSAQISIQNTAIGVNRELITDSAGFDSAPNLLAGTYEVRISAKGFRTAMESNVTLGLVASEVRALAREAKRPETV